MAAFVYIYTIVLIHGLDCDHDISLQLTCQRCGFPVSSVRGSQSHQCRFSAASVRGSPSHHRVVPCLIGARFGASSVKASPSHQCVFLYLQCRGLSVSPRLHSAPAEMSHGKRGSIIRPRGNFNFGLFSTPVPRQILSDFSPYYKTQW